MKAQIKPVTCKLQIGVDYEITKPNLALTPQNIKDLTDRGIAVNLPNEKQFLEGDSISSAKSWDVEPVFKRSAAFSLARFEASIKPRIVFFPLSML